MTPQVVTASSMRRGIEVDASSRFSARFPQEGNRPACTLTVTRNGENVDGYAGYSLTEQRYLSRALPGGCGTFIGRRVLVEDGVALEPTESPVSDYHTRRDDLPYGETAFTRTLLVSGDSAAVNTETNPVLAISLESGGRRFACAVFAQSADSVRLRLDNALRRLVVETPQHTAFTLPAPVPADGAVVFT